MRLRVVQLAAERSLAKMREARQGRNNKILDACTLPKIVVFLFLFLPRTLASFAHLGERHFPIRSPGVGERFFPGLHLLPGHSGNVGG
jgi:hypothetical protein